MNEVRLAFAGTGSFALPTLRALAARGWVKLVISQPDRPAGRGLKTSAPPVAQEAARLGLPLVQPRSINAADVLEHLAALNLDLIVVADFGQLLRRRLLDVPRLGCINIHGSLLPRWRGAAPVARAVVSGDRETGVTTMCVDEGMDTGPILLQRRTRIGPDETTEEVEERLAELGAELAVQSVIGLVEGTVVPCAQPPEGTEAPKLRRDEGAIDWSAPSEHIHNLVRGMVPWPCASTVLGDKRVKVLRSRPTLRSSQGLPPGAILPDRRGLFVATGDGVLELLFVQPEGCRPMSGLDFLNGHCRAPHTRLGAA